VFRIGQDLLEEVVRRDDQVDISSARSSSTSPADRQLMTEDPRAGKSPSRIHRQSENIGDIIDKNPRSRKKFYQGRRFPIPGEVHPQVSSAPSSPSRPATARWPLRF
jgi:hypothetical protein